MVYICQVIGFTRRPRGRAIGFRLIVLSLILLGFLGGCGSDSGSGEGEGTSEAGSSSETTLGDQTTAEPRNTRKAEGERSTKGAGETAKGVDPHDEKKAEGPDEGIDGRKVARICTQSLKRAECESVVKDLAEPSPSHTMEDPHDCLAVMSKEECEALAKAVTGTPSGSVNVEECLKNPTPHCEEVLGAALEAMYEAHQAGR